MSLDDAIVAAVRAAVRAELEELLPDMQPEPGPALVDRQGIAQALSVSAGTIDKLRKSGLPTVMVAGSPRFEVAACVAWLRSRSS